MVGDIEEILKQNGRSYVVDLCPYYGNSRARILGDERGFVKLVFQREGMRLLGVHGIGERATESVHIGLLAMLTQCTAELFSEMCFNLPSLGELYNTAWLGAILRVTMGRPLVDVPPLDSTHD